MQVSFEPAPSAEEAEALKGWLPPGADTIERAGALLALRGHAGQFRKFGQPGREPIPYITHCADVAHRIDNILGQVAPPAWKAIAWCHDLVEDTGITYTQIEAYFKAAGTLAGPVVAEGIYWLTNVSADLGTRNTRNRLNQARLCAAPEHCLLIKFADIQSNLPSIARRAPTDFAALVLEEKGPVLRAITERFGSTWGHGAMDLLLQGAAILKDREEQARKAAVERIKPPKPVRIG